MAIGKIDWIDTTQLYFLMFLKMLILLNISRNDFQRYE